MAAAFGAGLMNSVAGGGSFLTFPALVFTGVPSIIANATSTVALFPGTFASAWAYRSDLKGFDIIPIRAAIAVSMAGGLTGALLLLFTSQRTFDVVVPWLLLLATLAFTFGQRVALMAKRKALVGPRGIIVLQFFMAIYGGYFGGAVGLLMLALWTLIGLSNIHAMNAGKTLLAGSMNATAVVCFVIAGKVWWLQTAMMLVAAVIGGYAGARIAKVVNVFWVRGFITVLSFVVTVLFFLRA
jgi:uncharacterized protein